FLTVSSNNIPKYNNNVNVEQNTTVQTAVEGAAVTISCQYETTDISPDLFWYQQKVNGFPEYMLNRFGTNDKPFKERFNGDLNTISKSFPLTIQDVRVSDSAVYYCALRPTVTKTHSTFMQKPCVRKFSF
uniref:T-cell receptor alpha/delta variable 30.0.6 n=1 Tax=Sinocyclocheilus grahami TaxID=75366 RepID=A0A672PES8_SINGR